MMYDSLDELWLELLQQLLKAPKVPSRDGDTQEILGVNFHLNPSRNFLFNPQRKISAKYAAAELIWYLSGTSSIEMIKHYAPQYERFANDGYAWGAYGHRWVNDYQWGTELVTLCSQQKINLPVERFFTVDHKWVSPLSQLQGAIWLLSQQPNSRQAIVSMWNAGDLAHALAKDKGDLPCTIAMQFILREKLHLQVFMRSQDIWLGLPYDVWAFTCIQKLAAEALKAPVGTYMHSVTSLHLYDRNYEKAKQCIVDVNIDDLTYDGHKCGVPFAIKETILAEEFMRTKTSSIARQSIDLMGKNSLLCQCLAMLAGTDIVNNTLREFIDANS